MKIAYLNPWNNAAENQAFASLKIAGSKIGADLINCSSAEDIEAANPDFVISVASSVPKVADIPSYLTVHEPTSRFLQSDFYFDNMRTYDGFLTISDTLKRFAQDVSFGIGRPDETGFYFNTPQKVDLRTNFNGDIRIAYFGTNWDRRMPGLFKILDSKNALRIHGPTGAWAHLNFESYQGPLPFDGMAPQRTYAETGLGLVLLSDQHTAEDVISNRIFEISSVGAVAICPDIPWIRKWFGDSVFYFPPRAPLKQIAGRILEVFEDANKRPDQLRDMGDRSRTIFEEHFCGERLLSNAVEYHHARSAARAKARPLGNFEISVIVRCGGRPLEMLEGAVRSIEAQSVGTITIIFVKYKDMDISPITSRLGGAVKAFKEIFLEDGGRSETLAAGLAAVETEYVAILDDDDFWLSDHFEALFSAAKATDPDFDLAFSGTVEVLQDGREIETNLFWKRTVSSFGFKSELNHLFDLAGVFASNCFVAKSSLIPAGIEDLPSMDSAEDSFIIGLLARNKRPVFSYKATAFFRRGRHDQSVFGELDTRSRDLQSVQLRLGMLYAPKFIAKSTSLISAPTPTVSPLGATRLDDEYQEYFDVLPKSSIGPAGHKSAIGVQGNGQSGNVLHGPYISLEPRSYEVEFVISTPEEQDRGSWFDRKKKPNGPIGSVDVISLKDGWTGFYSDINRASRTIRGTFEVTKPEMQIEFRVETTGETAIDVLEIRLYPA